MNPETETWLIVQLNVFKSPCLVVASIFSLGGPKAQKQKG